MQRRNKNERQFESENFFSTCPAVLQNLFVPTFGPFTRQSLQYLLSLPLIFVHAHESGTLIILFRFNPVPCIYYSCIRFKSALTLSRHLNFGPPLGLVPSTTISITVALISSHDVPKPAQPSLSEIRRLVQLP